MARTSPLALAAFLVAFACSGITSRQLQQTSGTVSYPGCLPFSQSEVATNPDFSDFYALLKVTGLYVTLSNLEYPVTLFAATNEALEDFSVALNVTTPQAYADPHTTNGLLYAVATEAIMDLSDFEDGEVLTTLLANGNLTVMVESVSGVDTVIIDSYGSESTIVTPAAYACNLVIYGLNGAIVPAETIPFDSAFFGYLEFVLKPGGAEVPASLVVDAVNAGDTATVAAVFDQAVQAGYTQQLVAILNQAVSIPGGVVALASVANEMIVLSGCGTLLPLIHQLYPTVYSTPASLGLSAADLASVPSMDPRLASCAINGV